MKLNKLKQIIKEEIQKLQSLNEVENIVTKHVKADDGGIFCRYVNTATGASSSFYLDEPPCPAVDEIDPPSASTGGSVMVKIPGVATPVSVTTTPGRKPVRAKRSGCTALHRQLGRSGRAISGKPEWVTTRYHRSHQRRRSCYSNDAAP